MGNSETSYLSGEEENGSNSCDTDRKGSRKRLALPSRDISFWSSLVGLQEGHLLKEDRWGSFSKRFVRLEDACLVWYRSREQAAEHGASDDKTGKGTPMNLKKKKSLNIFSSPSLLSPGKKKGVPLSDFIVHVRDRSDTADIVLLRKDSDADSFGVPSTARQKLVLRAKSSEDALSWAQGIAHLQKKLSRNKWKRKSIRKNHSCIIDKRDSATKRAAMASSERRFAIKSRSSSDKSVFDAKTSSRSVPQQQERRRARSDPPDHKTAAEDESSKIPTQLNKRFSAFLITAVTAANKKTGSNPTSATDAAIASSPGRPRRKSASTYDLHFEGSSSPPSNIYSRRKHPKDVPNELRYTPMEFLVDRGVLVMFVPGSPDPSKIVALRHSRVKQVPDPLLSSISVVVTSTERRTLSRGGGTTDKALGTGTAPGSGDGTVEYRIGSIDGARLRIFKTLIMLASVSGQNFVLPSMLSVKSPLGRGATASVSRASYLGSSVAIKEITVRSDGSLQTMLDEINTLQRLQHPNVIKLFGVTWREGANEAFADDLNDLPASPPTPDGLVSDDAYELEMRTRTMSGVWRVRPCIVMEYCSYDLERFRTKFSHKWTSEIFCKIVDGIIGGMNFLHRKNCLHRDLKPHNILLTSRIDVKISDFGISLLDEEDAGIMHDIGKGVGGTAFYMAPEILPWRGKSQTFSAATDVWAFGVLLYELWTNTAAYMSDPHVKKSKWNLFGALLKGARLLMKPSNSLDEAYEGFALFPAPSPSEVVYDDANLEASLRKYRGATFVASSHSAAWPEELVALISACWAHEPSRRPSFDVISRYWDTLLTHFEDDDTRKGDSFEMKRTRPSFARYLKRLESCGSWWSLTSDDGSAPTSPPPCSAMPSTPSPSRRRRSMFRRDNLVRTFFDAVVDADVSKISSMLKDDVDGSAKRRRLLSARDRRGRTALMLAAASKSPATVVRALLLADRDDDAVGVADKMGRTALHHACGAGCVVAIDAIVRLRPSFLNVMDRDGTTALQEAAIHGHAKILEEMIDEHGADAKRARSVDGYTALCLSAMLGRERCVVSLLARGCDRTTPGSDGWTFAMWAWVRQLRVVSTDFAIPSLSALRKQESRIAEMLAQVVQSGVNMCESEKRFWSGAYLDVLRAVWARTTEVERAANARVLLTGIPSKLSDETIKAARRSAEAKMRSIDGVPGKLPSISEAAPERPPNGSAPSPAPVSRGVASAASRSHKRRWSSMSPVAKKPARGRLWSATS
eukprot:g1301.t1